ncbi:hypothetical protein DF186_23770, partial [Enterococcus hirae]
EDRPDGHAVGAQRPGRVPDRLARVLVDGLPEDPALRDRWVPGASVDRARARLGAVAVGEATDLLDPRPLHADSHGGSSP